MATPTEIAEYDKAHPKSPWGRPLTKAAKPRTKKQAAKRSSK
jgi:hypothetical protein